MFESAINNEALGRLDSPMPLINNLIYWRYDAMTENSITKTCPKCKVEKSVGGFYENHRNPDGYSYQCKTCVITRQKKYNLDHKKSVNAYNKQYHADNRERLLVCQREYYRDHVDESRLYRQLNKEKIAARDKAYRKTESGRNAHNKKSHNRRARLAGAKMGRVDPIEIFERDAYICQLCGVKTRFYKDRFHSKRSELDHIIPISKGGEHSRLNTQCLCRHCNATKRNTGKGDQLRLFG